jgi:iron complex outermembrane receptor protein
VFDKAPVYASTSYLNDFVQGQSDLIGRYIYANMRYQFQ